MALEYLKRNADTWAAGNWETAAGAAGSGVIAGATLRIASGRQAVDSGVDFNTISITSLDILPQWSGNLGSDSNHCKVKPIFTAESASDRNSRIWYRAGGGQFWLDVVDGTLGAHFIYAGGGGNLLLCGGMVKHLEFGEQCAVKVVDGAGAAASGVWKLFGGSVLIDSSTAGNLTATLNVYGNRSDSSAAHETRRGSATTNIYSGDLIIDCKNDTHTNLNLYGGRCVLRSHNATGGALAAYSGVLDFSQLTRAVAFANPTLGEVDIVGFKSELVSFTGTITRVGNGPRGITV